MAKATTCFVNDRVIIDLSCPIPDFKDKKRQMLCDMFTPLKIDEGGCETRWLLRIERTDTKKDECFVFIGGLSSFKIGLKMKLNMII